MSRSIAWGLAAVYVATVAAANPSSASHHRPRHHVRSYHSSERYAPRYRSDTVAPNGTCQRDTGTPTSDLNFHNRCDMQEFWTRQQEKAPMR